MRIPIVNEQDELLYCVDSEERDFLNEVTRIVGIWVFDEHGSVLISKRSKHKKKMPDLWGPSVAGSVEEGETYESNAHKELQEEIGVISNNLILGPKDRVNTQHAYFCQWFFVTIPHDTLFTLQEIEVDEVRWTSIPDLEESFKNEPDIFVPAFPMCITALKKYETQNKTS